MGDTLERLLEKARQHKMTPAEIAAQRESFVRAEIGFGSDQDEADMRAAYDRGDTAEIERLTAAGKARMDAYDRERQEERVKAAFRE